MLRQIRVKKNFKQIVDTPLVTGDTKAYEVVWDIGEEAANETLQIIARRNDLSMICDTCEIGADGVARYVLKNNMYAISGSMRLSLSVVSGDSVLTEKILCFKVILGADAIDVNAQDDYPAITKLIIDVNSLKEHTQNTLNPHIVTKKQLGLEYVDNAFAGIMTNTLTGEGSVEVTDANEYLKINSIGVLGNCIQNSEPSFDNPAEVVCVENPEITVGDLTVKLDVKLYGIKNTAGEFIARDRIYAENGKMYLSRGVCVFDKPEDFSFSLFSQDSDTNLFKNSKGVSSKSGNYGFSNRIPYRYIFSDNGLHGIMASANLVYMRLPKDMFPDAESVNNKIKEIFDSGEKFELYYAYKEPVVTEIENSSLLPMLDLKGNVSATATANIIPGVEIGYNQKLNGVIEEIKNAIIAMGGEIA